VEVTIAKLESSILSIPFLLLPNSLDHRSLGQGYILQWFNAS